MENKKIVVGMSGGVDSSIALLLLKKQGWQPIGVSLKLPVWKNRKNILRENVCCTKESTALAQKICQKLDVPYYIFDVRKDFQKEVVDYFISEFKKGRTPNPCVICNRCLKFKKLFVFAKKIGAKYVATGHYAKIKFNSKTGKYELLKARDKIKDQSYNLCFLPQKWLKNIIFPLENLTKNEVYEIAQKQGFNFFLKKKQSQDFCFVAGQSLHCFLKNKLGEKTGLIIDDQGKILGQHQGLHFYTIGQRKGLNLSNGPYFVKGFDFSKNILIVTKNKKKLTQKEIILSSFYFISGKNPKKKKEVMAKVRYQQPLSKATIYLLKNNPEPRMVRGKVLKIVFLKPQLAVTPGQFCVFYQKNVCLGGGVIK